MNLNSDLILAEYNQYSEAKKEWFKERLQKLILEENKSELTTKRIEILGLLKNG